MDIQEAYTFIENNFTKKNLQTFKKQTALFKVEPTTKLKEYLDFIHNDPVHWLSSFPDDLTCKSAFHQYKEPIYKLLKDAKLHEDYGENYCINLMNTIKQAFKINCQDIIDNRKNSRKPTEIITFDDSSSNNTDTESEVVSELDIKTLEPVDKSNHKDTQNTNVENSTEVQYHLKSLQDKLAMQEKYYESIIEYYKTTNEQLMKLLGQITTK